MPRVRRTPPEKPCCQLGPRWVRERLKSKTALAPLTGQDWCAFTAFFHLVALYGSSDEDGRRCAVKAMAYTVRAMQPSTRHLAKAGIPCVLDWSHEEEIWGQIESLDSDAMEDTLTFVMPGRRLPLGGES